MISECGDESSTERETHGIAERGRVKHQRDSFALHQISLAAFFTLLFLAQPVLIHRKSRAFDVRLPWVLHQHDPLYKSGAFLFRATSADRVFFNFQVARPGIEPGTSG